MRSYYSKYQTNHLNVCYSCKTSIDAHFNGTFHLYSGDTLTQVIIYITGSRPTSALHFYWCQDKLNDTQTHINTLTHTHTHTLSLSLPLFLSLSLSLSLSPSLCSTPFSI
ncbi:hypothetical protein EGW08_012578 [Elysia chlorotica]|uniref:Uncharacterized protein n=1 Tax=Elysia chlorotica TaxID=188477 RepID=A0A3S1C0L2_ELYCH|nr:hypothetical protein EGW08_012578 [Elysia chlorotica]